jgi:hypothetical protein
MHRSAAGVFGDAVAGNVLLFGIGAYHFGTEEREADTVPGHGRAGVRACRTFDEELVQSG